MDSIYWPTPDRQWGAKRTKIDEHHVSEEGVNERASKGGPRVAGFLKLVECSILPAGGNLAADSWHDIGNRPHEDVKLHYDRIAWPESFLVSYG